MDPLSLSRKASAQDSAFSRVNSICKKLSMVEANRTVILGALGRVAAELGTGSTQELRDVRDEMARAASQAQLVKGGGGGRGFRGLPRWGGKRGQERGGGWGEEAG